MKVDFCKVLACFFVLFMICLKLPVSSADVVTFGSGSNTFTLTFEAVEDLGNAADSNGFGAVGYAFGMSRYEISEKMIDVYNSFASNPLFQIAYDDSGRGANKPATSITWNEAARFVNWLNTSRGYRPAYNFQSEDESNIVPWTDSPEDIDDFQEDNPYRSMGAAYVLPSLDEWFKAAYYSPTLNAGAGGYWDYSVKTNSTPNSVTGGTGATDVVYGHGVEGSPADVTNAGGLSEYNIMAMNGNAWEWTESPENGRYGSGASDRAIVGGSWADMTATDFRRERVLYNSPEFNLAQAGFRVVSLEPLDFAGGGDDGGIVPFGDSTVPEPSICFLCGTLSLAAACRKKLTGQRSRR
jgi:sulfatase modifying factor 1